MAEAIARKKRSLKQLMQGPHMVSRSIVHIVGVQHEWPAGNTTHRINTILT